MSATAPERLWEYFERLIAADTSVRPERNAVAPDDPRVAAFAVDVAAPMLRDLGADVAIDRCNNVLATFGPRSGEELLFMCYPVTHHGNEMDAPLQAGRRSVEGREAWRGLGASQGKGGMASVLAGLHGALEAGVALDGAVAVAINSEGSSSHRSSQALYAGLLAQRPAAAVLAMGTGNQLVLGNRGRVDIVVQVAGRAAHSSGGGGEHNPIERVGRVLERLAHIAPPAGTHDRLGARAVVPYKLICGPIAPHTIPRACTVVIDWRLLPGDDPTTATATVERALAGLDVTVEPGAMMLPALVSESDPFVERLQAAAEDALGAPLPVLYPLYTFDSGYGCSIGVPTVMCGPATSDTSGGDVLDEDFVARDQLIDAALLYGGLARRTADALIRG